MNPSAPTSDSLEREVAAHVEQREKEYLEWARQLRLKYLTKCLTNALKTLPSELRTQVDLISHSKDERLIRLEIGHVPFELEVTRRQGDTFGYDWTLRHAGLQHADPVRQLSDFSRVTAIAVHTRRLARLPWEILGNLALIALTGYLTLLSFSQLNEHPLESFAQWTASSASITMTLVMIAHAASSWPRKLVTLETPGKTLCEAFSAWQAQTVDKTRGEA